MTRKALISALVVAGVAAIALVAERQAEATGEIFSKQLLVSDLAGEPGKEVDIRLYTFPPRASVPWHIHPDAHEFNYEIEGALTLQTEGEGTKVLKRGEATYVQPNLVHRGINASRTEPATLVVVRVKPKDKPLVTEIKP
jgi:quercetin dioxygenase-like cupin family protein